MARNLNVDLNKYEKVDELPSYDGLKLTLQTPEGQDPLPPIFFVKKSKQDLVTDPISTIWKPTSKIHMYGTPEQYKVLVDWWYDQMLMDAETKTILNDLARNATEKGLDLKKVVQDSREWLYKCPKSKRKSDLKKFIVRWVTNSVTRYLKYHK